MEKKSCLSKSQSQEVNENFVAKFRYQNFAPNFLPPPKHNKLSKKIFYTN